MKNIKSLALMLFVLSSIISAQNIKIFGDAVVRPRYDAIDQGNFANSTYDFHYLYRARLNVRSELDQNWFFQTQLAHAGYGSFAFAGFERTEYRIPGSIEGAIRPGVHFMNLYFGRSGDDWSLMAGLLPVNGLENPLLDIHYYPSRIVDIPFALFSVNGAFGATGHFNLAGNKFEYSAYLDGNEGKFVESPAGNELYSKHDNYTFMLRYNIAAGGFTVSPVVMYALANDSTAAPLTLGGIVKLPEVGGVKLSAVVGTSSQSKVGTTEYSIFYSRVRGDMPIGPATFTLWFDFATRTDKYTAGDEEHTFTYIWAKYNYPVVKTDKGSLYVGPTFRWATDKADNVKDFSRIKAEVTVTYTFR